MTTFVDSSAWYAAADADDLSHRSVTAVLAVEAPLVTTDHILVETWFLLNRRIGRREAETFLRRCIHGRLAIEIAGRADLERALDIAERYADQNFSFVDRTSFAVMERLGLDRVVSLDDHFAIYRWGPQRRQSFTVLR